MSIPRFVIAGTHSGAGKTTVTLAILAALRKRGRRVQPFKVGPDFIDPSHHAAAAGRPSRNLDGWMLGADLNREICARASADADISVIEGVMGLFDGSSPVNEIGSTAELAKQVAAPVLLVIDASAMARSAAAMVSGYANFDPDLRVAGVLFNRVSSEGHYHLLKAAVEQETDVAVVGYLRPDPAVTIADRHLGLHMALEDGMASRYDRLAQAAEETIDLDQIEALARMAGPFTAVSQPQTVSHGRTVRIAVAQDRAFCFYYPDNLAMLVAEGAEIVPFSPLTDHTLPDDVALVYLGGGYPELHAAALEGNVAMREAIRRFAAQGGGIYAECGGLMYLTQGIRDFDGSWHEMAGIFPAEAVMQRHRMTLGYRTLTLASSCLLGEAGVTARGHEFHYSTLVPKGPLTHAASLSDAKGDAKGADGLVWNNVLAQYTHLHFASNPEIPASLVARARQIAAGCDLSRGRLR